MNLRQRIEKYKKKSLKAKISDGIFIIFIIAMLTPSGRLAIGGFVNRIKALIVSPSVKKSDELVQLTNTDYNWVLTDIHGNSVNFFDFKGKVIFLNFWATWCPPCVGEMPEIENLYQKYKSDNQIQFLSVTNEPISKAREFIKKRDYHFPVFSSETRVPSVFNSNVIPVTFIISKDGKIYVKETGASNWSGKTSINLIEKLLKE